MTRQLSTVAYIPARSGSSRLQGKNVLSLGGHPLLAYTIRMALLSPGIDTVVVDTDSEEYAGIAREYGATVPFLRPADLAQKNSSLNAAFNHFVAKYEEMYAPIDRVVHFLPTSPFRNIETVGEIISMLDRYFKVTTVFRADFDLERACVSNGQELSSLNDLAWYRFNPDLYWVKPLSYISCSWVPVNDNPLCWYGNFAYYFLSNPIEVVDIDTQEEFECAQEVINNGLYDFGVDLWQE